MMVMMESLLLTFDKFGLDHCQRRFLKCLIPVFLYSQRDDFNMCHEVLNTLGTLDYYYVLLMLLLLLLFIMNVRLCFNEYGKIVS